MKKGDKFGDVALQSTSNKRTASIITIEPCIFAVMDKKSYYKSIREANEKLKRIYVTFLINNKLFFECDKFIFMKTYFNFFVGCSFVKGEKLMEEDKIVDYVYFIRVGEYRVSFRKSLFEIIHIIKHMQGNEKTKDNEIEEMQCKHFINKIPMVIQNL